jgi:hypothetical protein
VVTALGRGDGTPEAIIMYYNCTVFLSVPRRTVAEGSTNKQTRRNNRTPLIPWHVRGRHVSPRTNTQDTRVAAPRPPWVSFLGTGGSNSRARHALILYCQCTMCRDSVVALD